jgi:hypothetical protein
MIKLQQFKQFKGLKMKEKIKLLTDLNSALEDTELFSTLEARSNGMLIASILKKGIESEIESIFTNASDPRIQQSVTSILESLIKAEALAKSTSLLLETQSVRPTVIQQAAQAPVKHSVPLTTEPVVTQLIPALATVNTGLQNVGGRSFTGF